MWTSRHARRLVADDEPFQFRDHLRAEHMLDHVGIPIDMAGSDIGVGDEVRLPQAVIANQPACFLDSVPRQSNAIPVEHRAPGAFRAPGDATKLPARPGSQGNQVVQRQRCRPVLRRLKLLVSGA